MRSSINLLTIHVPTNKFTDMSVINMLKNLDFSPHVQLEREKNEGWTDASMVKLKTR